MSPYLFDQKETCSFIKQHQNQRHSRDNQQINSIHVNNHIRNPREKEYSSANKWWSNSVRFHDSILSVVATDSLFSQEFVDDKDIQSTLSSPSASISIMTTQPVRSYNSSRHSSSIGAKPHLRKIVYCGKTESEPEYTITFRQQFEIELRRKLNEQKNHIFKGFRRTWATMPVMLTY